MRCPKCSQAELAPDTGAMPFIYKGETTWIPKLTGDFCAVCGEGVFDAETSRRISADMKSFTKQVNAAITEVRRPRHS